MKSYSQLFTIFLLLAASLESCDNSRNGNSNTEINSLKQDEISKQEGKIDNPIYTKTNSLFIVGGKEVSEDTIELVSTEYFEISLCEMASDTLYYTAQRKIESPKSLENFRLINLHITDKEGKKPLKFKGATDFLNFMSEHNYEMINQVKKKYDTDYTFKKKK